MTSTVTHHTRPSTKRKIESGRKALQKRGLKRRDLTALSLQDPRFRKRVVKSAKAYSRKSKLPSEDQSEP